MRALARAFHLRTPIPGFSSARRGRGKSPHCFRTECSLFQGGPRVYLQLHHLCFCFLLKRLLLPTVVARIQQAPSRPRQDKMPARALEIPETSFECRWHEPCSPIVGGYPSTRQSKHYTRYHVSTGPFGTGIDWR